MLHIKNGGTMRVINLDETGIKIISSTKHQIYLTLNEVKSFIKKNYTITDNKLTFNTKTLQLSDKDVEEFPNILNYLISHFE
jgi:hypothetical protein